jgi:hypothetical protein
MLSSCGDDGSYHQLDERDEVREAVSELRLRQHLRYFYKSEDGEYGDEMTLDLDEPGWGGLTLAGICWAQGGQCVSGTDNCYGLACRASQELCHSHLMLDMADVAGDGREYGWALLGSEGTILIPPQSAATRAKLREVAFRHAVTASEAVIDALRSAQGLPAGGTCLAEPDPEEENPVPLISDTYYEDPEENISITYAEFFGTTLVETLEVAQEAIDLAVESNVAQADAHFSERRSLAVAAALNQSAKEKAARGA